MDAVAQRPATTSALLESQLAALLTEVLDSQVDPTQHFFEELGADSLRMAHFCARVRKQAHLPPVSMRDVYAHPTIARLAEALGTRGDPAVDASTVPAPIPLTTGGPAHPVRTPARRGRVIGCGLAQALIFTAYSYLFVALAVPGYGWIAEAPGWGQVYLRSVVVGGALFVAVCGFPIMVKWILVGRWRPREIPLWSADYVRFWIVKTLLHGNPMILFVGSPVYVLYLRALGAKIGRGATILSRSVPVCTDLLSVGDGAVIRKDCLFLGYRAQDGVIQTGSVTVGAGALVGEKTVLDIDTVVGAGSQLGHTSSLRRHEQVPDGARWHGSPAEPTEIDYRGVPVADDRPGLRVGFTAGELIQTFLVSLPIATGGAYVLVDRIPGLAPVLAADTVPAVGTLVRALLLAAVLMIGFFVIIGLLLVLVPRITAKIIRPDTVYPMYGLHYSLHRATMALTNRRLMTWLFGDSSYITGYLAAIGYDLGRVEQTGSNFGTEVQHESPTLVRIGAGTMVADGLSILNAAYSASTFRLSRVSIGDHSFLGNNIAYPAGARIGSDCLLATKVMIPVDGPVRTGVGLLGSPAFEIPRTVDRDARFDDLRTGDRLRSALRGKNRYNLRSMIGMLGLRFVQLFVVSALGLAMLESGGVAGQLLLGAYAPLSLAVTAAFWILVERALCRFRPLEPRLCSIYDPYFWWHERLWKVPDLYLNAFNGTPFKPLIWRLLGVRVGAGVFDDGAYLTERTLTTLGDGAVLNAGSKLQCHSQEDGTFKSDRTVVGAGCTLGVGAFVHYGVTLGAGSLLLADSFLMKGEDVPDRQVWSGNPATTVLGSEVGLR